MKSLLIKIGISCLLTTVLGIASGFSTMSEITNWYTFLEKPPFNPPNWIFGPVWTLLYILMGISFALVWHSEHPQKKQAMTLFGIQFLLNMLWSFIFFNLHQTGWALVEIFMLLVMILLTTKAFYPINKNAAYLLLPYIAWVSFASFLNGAIWHLNK